MSLRTTMFPDLDANTDKILSMDLKAPRAHLFGPTYIYPEEAGEAFLPEGFENNVFRALAFDEPLEGFHGEPLHQNEKTAAAAVVQYLTAMALYSGTTNYGRACIGGDVGQRRVMNIDGSEKEVLVFPQAFPRAERTAKTLTEMRMTEHPFAGKAGLVLDRAVKVLELSTRNDSGLTASEDGTVNAYLRTFMGGGPGSHGANRDVVLKGLFSIATLQFSSLAPYCLPRCNKVVMESPDPLPGDAFAHWKHVSRYMRRVEELHYASRTPQAQEHGVNDLVFRGRSDPLFVDAVYTNLVYCASDPQRDRGVVMAFPVPSPENKFFLGMTAQTLYSLLDAVGEEHGVRPVKVHNAQELATAVGYSGTEPMKGALLEKIDGVLAPGTYQGPQWVHTWATLDGALKEFWSDGVVNDAAEYALRVYNDACWALHDGVLVSGKSFASDTRYCALFAVDDVQRGNVRPLTFERVEYQRREAA